MKKAFLLILACVFLLTGCAHVSLEDLKHKGNDPGAESAYLLPSDSQVITEVDLSKLNATELDYALQEIYARHGKVFSEKNYEKYFTAQSWYTPNPAYSDALLSAIEKENATYIAEYISMHAEASEPQEEASAQDEQPQKSTVVVVHDEGYYYDHYWGDNTFIIPDSSVRKLTKSELSGFSSATLALIRNEIYARNGYVFQKQKYQDYFGSKLWYSPNPNFNESWLNSVEKYNVQLIKSME